MSSQSLFLSYIDNEFLKDESHTKPDTLKAICDWFGLKVGDLDACLRRFVVISFLDMAFPELRNQLQTCCARDREATDANSALDIMCARTGDDGHGRSVGMQAAAEHVARRFEGVNPLYLRFADGRELWTHLSGEQMLCVKCAVVSRGMGRFSIA